MPSTISESTYASVLTKPFAKELLGIVLRQRELILEMRIRTKRGKGIELSVEGEIGRERERVRE